MGWSQSGNTRQRYQHYFASDAIEAMLIADGLVPPADGGGASTKSKKDLLKPKQCPNCDEPNKPESKFCVKCKFVLSFDAYNEVTEEAEQRAKELEEMKVRLDSFEKTEQARKEKEAELDERMDRMIARMDSMIIKMYEVNPVMPSELLTKKELQDTFVSIVGKERIERVVTRTS
jgi:hypothetical protein